MKRIFKHWALLLIFFALSESQLSAQDDPHFEIWTDFNPRVKLTNHLKLVGDIGYRIRPANSAQIFLARAALRYEPNRMIGVDAGLGTFNLWDTKYFNSTEFRVYEFFFFNWPSLWGFKVKSRVGFEQRWLKFHQLLASKFVHRFRLRIGIKSPEFKLYNNSPPFYITTNVEFLRDLNNELISGLIDHNRFMIGVGSQINEKLRTELQFQLMGLKDSSLENIIHDASVVRARVFYQFN